MRTGVRGAWDITLISMGFLCAAYRNHLLPHRLRLWGEAFFACPGMHIVPARALTRRLPMHLLRRTYALLLWRRDTPLIFHQRSFAGNTEIFLKQRLNGTAFMTATGAEGSVFLQNGRGVLIKVTIFWPMQKNCLSDAKVSRETADSITSNSKKQRSSAGGGGIK